MASSNVERQAEAALSQTAALGDRISHFVSENKRAVILSAVAATAVVGGAYYLYSASGPPPKPPSEGRKKAKKTKKSKPRGANKSEGTSAEEEAAASANLDKAEKGQLPAKVEEEGESNDPLKLSKGEIQALEEPRRHAIAQDLKTRGNKAYAARSYAQAIDLYSKAIECEEQAVYFSNRAACHSHLQNTSAVISDCSDALRLDPTYIKALNRRGAARESLGGDDNLFGSLCDYTAAAILDQFQTKSTSDSVDRIMKLLSQEQAAEMIKTREPRMPSVTFVKAYMDAFRSKPDAPFPDEKSQGDSTFEIALNAIKAQDYIHGFSLVDEALSQGISTDALQARAHNLRGTFRFIMGDAVRALEDLDKATDLDRNFTQTWVKKASVHMELGQSEMAMQDFQTAESIDAEDPDIYYHRGQVLFITQRYAEAIEQYKKSTELDGTFIFSQIQHAVALYKEERKEKAEARFKKLIKTFGATSPEVHNYYGELLLDQAAADPSFYPKATASFDRAIELEKKKIDSAPSTSQGNTGTLNVLPLVNKALCIFQADRNKIPEAVALVEEALRRDEQCDVGVATLAQLYLQQNKIYEAVAMFQKSADLSRTEQELVNNMTYLNATKAQIYFVENYPTQATMMGLKTQEP